MERIRRINFSIICIYSILTIFILPSIDTTIKRKVFIAIFMFINTIYILNNIKYFMKIKFRTKNIIAMNILIITIIANILVTKYSIGFTVMLSLYVIVINLSFDKNIRDIHINRNLNKIIYLLMIISIILQFITPKSVTNGKYTLLFVKDKNYSAIILFLFFIYCDKNKFMIGRVLCILISFILNSRAYQMMLISLFIIKICRKHINIFMNKLKLNNSYNIIIISTIGIILFSNYWINNIAIGSVKNYQEGLNDLSNKMRFAANLNALEVIKKDDKNGHLLLYGYDYDIVDVFGINENQAFAQSDNYGVRVVQPHNSILNVVIKSGIIISIFYFYVISKTIDIYFLEDNLEYIIPYFLNILFLHGLLDTDYLLFFLIVISLPICKKKYTKGEI